MKNFLPLLIISIYSINCFAQNDLLKKKSFKTQKAATIIGSTTYDYQINASMPQRIVSYPTGTITAIWNGSTQVSGFTDRGTFVATHNGTSWNAAPILRVENKTTGWCALAVTTNKEHIIAEPNIISTNNGYGTSFDTGRIFTSRTDLRGPHAAASGSYIHVLMAGTQYDSVSGFSAPLYYTRSSNQGTSFEPMSAIFAQAAGYDTSKHVGNVGPNAYCIDARGNTVAILIVGVTEDVVLLKSTNNGATWTKTIIREFPIKKYNGGITDKNGDGLMDTVLGVTGDASVVIDYDNVVHVVFSDLELFTQDTGALKTFPINRSDYFNYWNDKTKTSIQVPTLIDQDGNGIFDAGSNFNGSGNIQYGNAGYSFNPQLSINYCNDIFITYTGVQENDTTDSGVDFRNIYLTGTNDGVLWVSPISISQTINLENVYLSSTRRLIEDNKIHMIWQLDFDPGNAIQGQHVAGPSDIIYDEFYFGWPAPCFIGVNNSNLSPKNIKVYPNPTKEKFEIEIPSENNTAAKIRIIDVFGKSIYDTESVLNPSINKLEIVSKEFKPGVYIILIETNEGTISKKIIVE